MTVPSSRTSAPLLPGSASSMWCYGPRGRGLCAALFKVLLRVFYWWSEKEVSIPNGLASTGRVQRSYNLDNTGTVIEDLCTLALLLSCVKYTLTRSPAVLNRHSGDHPENRKPRFVLPEF